MTDVKKSRTMVRNHKFLTASASVAAAFVIGVVSVGAIWGWGSSWAWVSASWRLDVGEPATTSAYPQSIDPPAARLAVAGDVGTGGHAEHATAASMDDLETGGEFDALLLLGDNVYPDGSPELAGANVLDPFAAVLDGPTELVAALGNHDVVTGDGQPLLHALGLPGRWYGRRYGPVRVLVVDSTRASDPDQLAWLRDRLDERTDAAWTVVMQHHPPFSAGYHGSDAASQRHLVPLYEEAGVDLVLAGHDHDYQRTKPQDGVTYVVSGGGAKVRRTARGEFTAAAASTYHFVELAAYEDRLDVRAVNHDGRVVDSFSLES
jgi:predicted phosphodiesterase